MFVTINPKLCPVAPMFAFGVYGIGSSTSTQPVTIGNVDGSTETYPGGVCRTNMRPGSDGNWTWDGKAAETPLSTTGPVPAGAPHRTFMSTGGGGDRKDKKDKKVKKAKKAAKKEKKAKKDRERDRAEGDSVSYNYNARTDTLVTTSSSGASARSRPGGRLPDQHISGSAKVTNVMRF
jgi:hypothetical protein